MATQKQYLNLLWGFLFLIGVFLANFTPIANATENNFIKVDKNTNLEIYEWTHRPVVIFANSECFSKKVDSWYNKSTPFMSGIKSGLNAVSLQ